MATPQKISMTPVDIKWQLDGLTLDQAIEVLQTQQKTLTERGMMDLKLDFDYESDYEGGSTVLLNILGTRMETAEEAILREGNEKQRQRYLEQRERQQYEALKAKFG